MQTDSPPLAKLSSVPSQRSSNGPARHLSDMSAYVAAAAADDSDGHRRTRLHDFVLSSAEAVAGAYDMVNDKVSTIRTWSRSRSRSYKLASSESAASSAIPPVMDNRTRETIGADDPASNGHAAQPDSPTRLVRIKVRIFDQVRCA
jgi:hypothetical protein